MSDNDTHYQTKIWLDEPESDNPFAARASYCAGYDVFGDLLGKISWSDYLFLMFRLERPTEKQSRLLHELTVVLSHPGLRDHSVLAAMNAGVGGSTAAASLMAALGVGAGQLNGGHEVFLAMDIWQRCEMDIEAWHTEILNPPVSEVADIWDPLEHIAGFNPNSNVSNTTLIQALTHLASLSQNGPLQWLCDNRIELEKATQCGLSFSSIAAAAFHELGFNSEQGEMLYLILRLPGAGAQALEQKQYGWRRFPFYNDGLTLLGNQPGTPVGDTNLETENG